MTKSIKRSLRYPSPARMWQNSRRTNDGCVARSAQADNAIE
ncbi:MULTISPECIES: hypothetical protein [unclassified Erwinia]|nr:MULTISPECIES: hypothetical protein [unclassified Erwinia]